MNNYAGPSMALKVPELRTSFSIQALHFSKQMPGGVIVVGPDARRFADEKYKTRHGKVPVNGRWLPLSTPCPMFMILYHPHARCYLKSVIPAISDNACCVSGTKIR